MIRFVTTLFIAGLFTASCWAARPLASVPDATVFPTGVGATDRSNVQAAVNAGGTVLLKSTDASGAPAAFEFGAGRVLLSHDVAIVGETVAGRMTTIRHGIQPFRSMFGNPVKSAVRGIHFDSPTSAAVLLTYSRGFEFTDNVVTDVIGAPAFGVLKGQAVWITQGSISGAVTGDILIANNLVDRVFADLSYGVALAGFDASARIIGNTFRNTKDTGILVVFNSQPVSIEDNIVQGGAPYADFFSVGNGIFVGQGAGAFYIARNTIECDNPFADGIALSGVIDIPSSSPASSVVEKNIVTMRNSMFGGITIYGQVAPSLIANNKITGNGSYALDIVPYFGDEVNDSTVYRGNNISGFASTLADVFFDYVSHNTVLVGHSGTVIDNGVGDRITGFTPMRGGAGASLAAAQQQKRSLLRDLRSVLTAADDP